MNIQVAVKKVKELTDGELSRYAQLCEIEIVNYRETTKNDSVEKKLRYGTSWIQNLRDQKEMFLMELRLRQSALGCDE